MRINSENIQSLPAISDSQITRVHIVAQYADVGHESAPNRVRFGSGPVPGRHPVLGGGIGGLRQLGAELVHWP